MWILTTRKKKRENKANTAGRKEEERVGERQGKVGTKGERRRSCETFPDSLMFHPLFFFHDSLQPREREGKIELARVSLPLCRVSGKQRFM